MAVLLGVVAFVFLLVAIASVNHRVIELEKRKEEQE